MIGEIFWAVLEDLGRDAAKIFNYCRISADCMGLLSNNYKKDRKDEETYGSLPATDSQQ